MTEGGGGMKEALEPFKLRSLMTATSAREDRSPKRVKTKSKQKHQVNFNFQVNQRNTKKYFNMPVNAVVWSRHPWRFQDHLEDSAPLHGTKNWIAMI